VPKISREVMLERARTLRAQDRKRWTYRELGKYLGMSEMGAYYALNPEKRMSRSDREDGLRQHYLMLSDDEWATIEARALAGGVSAARLMRAILCGEEAPL
jgi:hypothetical protein